MTDALLAFLLAAAVREVAGPLERVADKALFARLGALGFLGTAVFCVAGASLLVEFAFLETLRVAVRALEAATDVF